MTKTWAVVALVDADLASNRWVHCFWADALFPAAPRGRGASGPRAACSSGYHHHFRRRAAPDDRREGSGHLAAAVAIRMRSCWWWSSRRSLRRWLSLRRLIAPAP
jgi:hypothetical protein